ncbi:hotdog domain-containing protein [uncultured Williamsia sp.]|uniref:hotdog domain-containing protein n=1 Tax=uncultured Williamsia sp. TaxID=259311 RepID=UPI002624D5AD|nr:hotdog domain-containing protein [uncultured Williamsia sp.]
MTRADSASLTIGDDPLTVFGVGGEPPTAPATRMRQRLGGLLVDHRGRIDIAAWAVLVDSAAGAPFVAQTPADQGVVQASLVFATTGLGLAPEGVLDAVATLRHDGGSFGLTSIDVAAGDDLVATVLARSARTGRVFDDVLRERLSGAAAADGPRGWPVPARLAADATPPPAIDPVLTGEQIVAAIVDGRMAAGPVADVLGLTPTAGGALFRPAPWMANALGSMHGGVVAAVVAQACSWAGQSRTGAGQDYRLADLSVDFFRSPPVDVDEMTIATRFVRVGRRVVSIAADLRAPDDTLVVQGSAAVHLT